MIGSFDFAFEEAVMRRAPVMFAVALVVVAGAGCGSSGKNNTAGSASAGKTVKIEADDFYFKPTDLKLTASTQSSLEIENEGKVEHNITIEGLGVDQDLEAGKTTHVSVPAKAGTYKFHCEYHPDKMKGTITVG